MPPKGEMTELVRQVMRAAHVGKTDAELVTLIAQRLGGYVYEPSVLASWRSGRYRPAAESIFAIALATGISLDEILYGKSLKDEMAKLADRVQQLEGRESP